MKVPEGINENCTECENMRNQIETNDLGLFSISGKLQEVDSGIVCFGGHECIIIYY